MSQRRFSHLAILNTECNVLMSKNDKRKRNFGSFTEQDLCYNLISTKIFSFDLKKLQQNLSDVSIIISLDCHRLFKIR